VDEQAPAPKSKRNRTIAYFAGMIALIAFISLAIANDITVNNYQAKFAAMGFGSQTSSLKTYDETALAAASVCGDIASRSGRKLDHYDLRPGFRPGPADESIQLKATDTFICVFTSGETIPFMATYVGGRIVDVQ